MQSAPIAAIEDLLPGPVADAASPILSHATALSLVHDVASAADPTIGSTCATPGYHLDPSREQKEQEMVPPGKDGNPDPSAEEEGSNIKPVRSEKYLK